MINDGSLSKYGTTSLVSGIIMVFISLFMQGCQYVIEEHVFTHHQVDPYMMVGTEGLYGTSYIFVVIFIMSFINCPSQLMCDVNGYFEDPISGLREIFASTELIIWSVAILIIILFINVNGLVLVKYVSCMFNAFWQATRCISVWIVSASLGLEKVEIRSASIQMVGFVLLVLGNLTYNEIIEWKCCGINKGMQKYKKFKISKRTKPLTAKQLHENELKRNSFLQKADDSCSDSETNIGSLKNFKNTTDASELSQKVISLKD